MATSLTDKDLKDLAAPAAGTKNHPLGEPAGFGLRVTQAGAKAFVLRYRAGRRERLLTIGSFPDWKIKAARERAAELKRLVDQGVDPLAQREAERTAPTMAELADRFLAQHASRRREASQRAAKNLLTLYVRPELGKSNVAAVRHADVEKLHRGIASGKLTPSKRPAPYQANRCVALLSKMFALAVKWEMRDDNPARGVEREPEEKRERFLSPVEIARLGEALAAHPERVSANAIRLLLLTGARKSELLGAKWSEFDLAAGTWTKPSAHTKQKKEHRVPLSARRRRDGLAPIEYAFPSTDGKPLRDVKKLWATVCRTAGLGHRVAKLDARGNPVKGPDGKPMTVWRSDARVHDLRHTFASVLASAGLSLPIIGSLLGHTQPGTTARYAHLLDDPLRAATERAAAVIDGAGRPSAEVVPLRSVG